MIAKQVNNFMHMGKQKQNSIGIDGNDCLNHYGEGCKG